MKKLVLWALQDISAKNEQKVTVSRKLKRICSVSHKEYLGQKQTHKEKKNNTDEKTCFMALLDISAKN